MKLSVFLGLLDVILGVNSAVAPTRYWGGNSHSHAIRSSKLSRHTEDRHHSGYSSDTGFVNATSNLPPSSLHSSSMDYYSNYTSPSPVATRRSKNMTTKSLHRSKRIPYYRPSGTKADPHIYAGVDSASRTFTGTGNNQNRSSAKTKIEARSYHVQKARTPNLAPTPAPTGKGSPDTTVFINNENDFALLLPGRPQGLVSEAEEDGVAYCTSGGCSRLLQQGFIRAAAVTRAPDNSSWIQVTGCIDPSKTSLSSSDDGGQFDVRFPNGAQCSFGGYGASFIEQVEPSANRFCLRCCAKENDQTNCNSHQDRAGCVIAIPGVYDFPEKGVSCA